MATKPSESHYSAVVKWLLAGCLACAAMILIVFSVQDAQAGTTGCWAKSYIPAPYNVAPYTTFGLTPEQATKAECPNPPCGANSKGAISHCITDGEDPPVSNAQWDEPDIGFQGVNSVMISGRCGPPITTKSGTNATNLNAAGCGVNSSNQAQPCLPIPNCPTLLNGATSINITAPSLPR